MKFEKKLVLRSQDTDTHNALKPTTLMQVLQEVAEDQITDNDKDYTEMYEIDRIAFILSRMNIEVFRPAGRKAKLLGRTWVTEGRAANFPRFYEIWTDGELIARAFSNWALVNVDTKKLIRYKDYDMSGYAKDEPEEMHIPLRFRFPADLEFEEVTPFHVGYCNTDINGHMNNTMYTDILFNQIPNAEEWFMTSLNVRFVHEAPLGADVKVFRSDFVDPEGMDPAADKLVYFRTEVEGESNVEIAFGLKKYAH